MKKTYELRERADVVYASSSQEDVSHFNRNGELNVDKAWRTLRRPSDMVLVPLTKTYLFRLLIVRLRTSMRTKSGSIVKKEALESMGSYLSKVCAVFGCVLAIINGITVVGLTSLRLPLPAQTTVFSCTLNNGIHYVTTPDCRLSRESRIDQEFEL